MITHIGLMSYKCNIISIYGICKFNNISCYASRRQYAVFNYITLEMEYITYYSGSLLCSYKR